MTEPDLTWDDVDVYPPSPRYTTVIIGETTVAVVGAADANDAVAKAFGMEPQPHTIVVVDGKAIVVKDAQTVDDAVQQALGALEATKSKPKRETRRNTQAPSRN